MRFVIIIYTIFPQVLGLKEHEKHWLTKHLGHTAQTHDLHYKSMSSYIERVNLGKLMMLQDYNAAHKFQGKDLTDVALEGKYSLK